MVNFGPAAAVVRTRLALRPILERTPYSYTLNPLLHSVVVLWPTHVIVSAPALLKPEGWTCVELQKGLEWDCVGGTSCVPSCLAPLLHPTVHLSSVMVYSPVVHHSALIKCYGIFPCCTPQCTYNVLWYSPLCWIREGDPRQVFPSIHFILTLDLEWIRDSGFEYSFNFYCSSLFFAQNLDQIANQAKNIFNAF